MRQIGAFLFAIFMTGLCTFMTSFSFARIYTDTADGGEGMLVLALVAFTFFSWLGFEDERDRAVRARKEVDDEQAR